MRVIAAEREKLKKEFEEEKERMLDQIAEEHEKNEESVRKLEFERKVLNDKIRELEETKAEIEVHASDIVKEAERLGKENKELQEQRNKVEKEKFIVDDLRIQLSIAREEVKKYQGNVVDLEQKSEDLQKELKSVRVTVEHQHAQQEKEAETIRLQWSQIEDLRNSEEEAERDLMAANKAIISFRAANEKLAGKVKDLKKQIESLTAQEKARKADLDVSKSTVANLRKANYELQTRISGLEVKLADMGKSAGTQRTPSKWKRSEHKGRTYYYNLETGTSSWEKPAGYHDENDTATDANSNTTIEGATSEVALKLQVSEKQCSLMKRRVRDLEGELDRVAANSEKIKREWREQEAKFKAKSSKRDNPSGAARRLRELLQTERRRHLETQKKLEEALHENIASSSQEKSPQTSAKKVEGEVGKLWREGMSREELDDSLRQTEIEMSKLVDVAKETKRYIRKLEGKEWDMAKAIEAFQKEIKFLRDLKAELERNVQTYHFKADQLEELNRLHEIEVHKLNKRIKILISERRFSPGTRRFSTVSMANLHQQQDKIKASLQKPENTRGVTEHKMPLGQVNEEAAVA